MVGVAMGRYIFQKCLISHLSGWFLKIKVMGDSEHILDSL
jgi:hypothetical protein